MRFSPKKGLSKIERIHFDLGFKRILQFISNRTFDLLILSLDSII